MKSKYLIGIKIFSYLYLIITLGYIVFLVGIGYFNYNNQFIGCTDGKCSMLWSFAQEGETYKELVEKDVRHSLKDKVHFEDSLSSHQGVIKEISPLLVSLFLVQSILIFLLVFFVIQTIKKIQKEGVFNDSIAESFKKLMIGFIVLIILQVFISVGVDMYTLDGGSSISLNSDLGFKLFMILLILFMADIIRQGALLRSENELTI